MKKGVWMKKTDLLLVFFATLFLLVAGCLENSEAKMRYNITYCEGGGPAPDAGFKVEKTTDGIIVIKQKENYVCCANISISMKAQNRTIEIYEENIGDFCRCICPFEAEITLENAKVVDVVRIYGIKYQDVYDYELMYEWAEK